MHNLYVAAMNANALIKNVGNEGHLAFLNLRAKTDF